MLVNLFFRKSFSGNYSIEILFKSIISNILGEVKCQSIVLPFMSKGVIYRIFNTVFAACKQADVNHITGDVHYIAFFMKKNKTILTIHDIEFLKNKSGWKRAVLKYFWITMPVKCSKYITVISEATKKELQKETNLDNQNIIV
jgi:hypothetical protein